MIDAVNGRTCSEDNSYEGKDKKKLHNNFAVGYADV